MASTSSDVTDGTQLRDSINESIASELSRSTPLTTGIPSGRLTCAAAFRCRAAV
jgi:hypothetical protein